MRRATSLRLAFVAAALVAALATLYLPVRDFGFLSLDDQAYVPDNPLVNRGLSAEVIRRSFTTFHAGNWDPLTWISHALDVSLFGMDAGRHHLGNVALHAANALLLFGVLHAATGQLWRSALAAGLFALHPLRVESVAWVAERKDVLCGLFWLLSLAAYLHYVRRPSPRRYLVAGAAFLLALLAKPMAVSLPLALLVLDAWPLGRARRGRRAALLAEKVPLLLLAAGSAVLTLAAQGMAGAVRPLAELPLSQRLANVPTAAAWYLGRALWPDTLTVFHPHLGARHGAEVAIASAALIAATAAGAWTLRRRHPALPAGAAWFLLTISPVLGVVQIGHQGVAERFTYLPLIGPVVALVWSAGIGWGKRATQLSVLAGACALGALSAITASQVQVWRDDLTLFSHAIAVNPRDADARAQLGKVLLARGRAADAVPPLRDAVRLVPGHAGLLLVLGDAFGAAGDDAAAERAYAESLRIDPASSPAHNNLGALLARTGRTPEAETHFRRSVALDPRNAEALANLGALLLARGDLAGADRLLAQAIAVEPGNWRARFQRARLRETSGRPGEAAQEYREVLRLRPDHRPSRLRLAALQEDAAR